MFTMTVKYWDLLTWCSNIFVLQAGDFDMAKADWFGLLFDEGEPPLNQITSLPRGAAQSFQCTRGGDDPQLLSFQLSLPVLKHRTRHPDYFGVNRTLRWLIWLKLANRLQTRGNLSLRKSQRHVPGLSV